MSVNFCAAGRVGVYPLQNFRAGAPLTVHDPLRAGSRNREGGVSAPPRYLAPIGARYNALQRDTD